ncbi:hypothetical protein ABH927_001093 [Planotetraspora sp. GP83]
MDDIVEEGWRELVAGEFGAVEPDDERGIAAMIAEEPDRHDWRVVDAALDRLTCEGCGNRLGRGPAGCARCDLAHGFRFSAVETDRPGVPPGNEHAIRVNVAVVRRPYGISAPELLARRMLLPALLVGFLPTTEEAQRMGAHAKKGATEEDWISLVGALVGDTDPANERSTCELPQVQVDVHLEPDVGLKPLPVDSRRDVGLHTRLQLEGVDDSALVLLLDAPEVPDSGVGVFDGLGDSVAVQRFWRCDLDDEVHVVGFERRRFETPQRSALHHEDVRLRTLP